MKFASLSLIFLNKYSFSPPSTVFIKMGESYQAVSLDLIHIRLEYKYQDKANREIIRHCQSPEVVTWAKEKDKGDFCC